jgi:hypothetical protein
VLDLNDFGAAIIDGVSEFLGKGVTCQLISSTQVDHSKRLTLPPSLSSDLSLARSIWPWISLGLG